MSPKDIDRANYLNKLKKWYWEGEPGFIKLVEDNQSPGMVVVEIGCYDGSTTRKYIDTVKKNNGHVILIDTFMGTENDHYTKEDKNNPHSYGAHNIGLYQLVKDKFEKYSDMITIIKGYSHEYIPNLPDNCDIIFIDADHTYKACKKDIELSIPKVKKGGILSGHDCEGFSLANNFPKEALELDFWNNMHPGVIQAVFDNFGVTKIKGFSVWYKTIK